MLNIGGELAFILQDIDYSSKQDRADLGPHPSEPAVSEKFVPAQENTGPRDVWEPDDSTENRPFYRPRGLFFRIKIYNFNTLKR